jgi:hypothetical protein
LGGPGEFAYGNVGCWFPSVDLVPAGAEQSRYSLYFSAGVTTEAQVVERQLNTSAGPIVQLVGADAPARSAAASLRRSLAARTPDGAAPSVIDIEVQQHGLAGVRAALASLGERDTLVLWLHPQELALLATLPATTAQQFVSATLGAEQPDLPASWRQHATLVQPLELAALRSANLARFEAWLAGSNVPLVDRRLQSEVYFAARSLQSTLRGMLNNLHADYLIERAEATLSMFEAMQLQDEIGAMMMSPVNKRPPSQSQPTPSAAAAHSDDLAGTKDHLEEMRKRGGTTVHSRLSLGQGQRFASKGAYLERLNPDSLGVIGEPLWVVP